MLDLLVINPGAVHGIYGILGDNLIAVEPPLWCRLIAGYVCAGEGPVTIEQLLLGLPPNLVNGLVWNNGSQIIKNPPAALINNLRVLQGDVWDLLPMHLYRAHNWQCMGQMERRHQPYASIYTSLSCPYKCQFCCISAPFLGSNKYRMRAPEDVVDE